MQYTIQGMSAEQGSMLDQQDVEAAVFTALSEAKTYVLVSMVFTKLDGTRRTMRGTVDPNLRLDHPCLTIKTEDGWRSARKDSIHDISVEYFNK